MTAAPTTNTGTSQRSALTTRRSLRIVWMGNDGFDLSSLKPATNQKEKDRQPEADN
jgi:hypothetical protein